MIEKEIFEQNVGRSVRLGIKPNNYGVIGKILDVYDDSIVFQSTQKTSYLSISAIETLIPMEE
jgi:hypothetical protein